LRNAEEVVAAKELPSVRVSLSQKEINLGKQLVELLGRRIRSGGIQERITRSRLMEFIESKSRGKLRASISSSRNVRRLRSTARWLRVSLH
jgi:hypothetical protein